MSIEKQLKSYAKEIIARLKGDADEKVAAQNERKARVAAEGNISALKTRLLDDEENLIDAKEARDNAIYPIERITDNETYIQGIIRAEGTVQQMEEELKTTKESIEYWEKFLKERF